MKTVNWTHNASRFCEIAFKANRGDKIKILREKKGYQGTRVGSLVCETRENSGRFHNIGSIDSIEVIQSDRFIWFHCKKAKKRFCCNKKKFCLK